MLWVSLWQAILYADGILNSICLPVVAARKLPIKFSCDKYTHIPVPLKLKVLCLCPLYPWSIQIWYTCWYGSSESMPWWSYHGQLFPTSSLSILWIFLSNLHNTTGISLRSQNNHSFLIYDSNCPFSSWQIYLFPLFSYLGI